MLGGWSVAGAANYAIDRSSDGVTYSQIGTSGSTNYADNSLSGAQRYFYRVAAIDGASTRSAPSAVATNINRPSAVTALPVASWTNSSVVINWLDTTNETGYRIERSSDGTNFGTLINLAANVRSYGLVRFQDLNGDGLPEFFNIADPQCPVCASESFTFLTRWVPVDERRRRARPAPAPAPASAGARWVKRGVVGLTAVAVARWLWNSSRPVEWSEPTAGKPSDSERS